MLIIGFGVTEVLLSTLVFTCETCGNHAAHQLTKQTRKFSLFFIPLFSVGTKYLDSCTACGGSSRSARSRQRLRPGKSARTCGDSAEAFISAQGRPNSGRRELPGPISMWTLACTSEAQRFKIHWTTAATLLRRYAGL